MLGVTSGFVGTDFCWLDTNEPVPFLSSAVLRLPSFLLSTFASYWSSEALTTTRQYKLAYMVTTHVQEV